MPLQPHSLIFLFRAGGLGGGGLGVIQDDDDDDDDHSLDVGRKKEARRTEKSRAKIPKGNILQPRPR